MFENIHAFKERRSKVTFSSKPFSKTKLANEFALFLCKDLKDNGLEILHETESDTRVRLQTNFGHKFTIRPDAVVLMDHRPKVYIEIKYMEEGIFNTPDTRKIAYDFLHFRQKHKSEFYVVISGAKLAAHKDVEPMLQTFTDSVFDVDVTREGWESRLRDMTKDLQVMLNMDPQKDLSLLNNVISNNELLFKSRQPGNDRLTGSLSYATSKGFEFERHLKHLLTEAEANFEPKKGILGKKVELPGNKTITVAPDVWIPGLTNPTLVLECKNMKHLDPSFSKTIAMDSMLLKNAIPSLRFIVICGERTRTVSTDFMRGYVDELITYDRIQLFIDKMSNQF